MLMLIPVEGKPSLCPTAASRLVKMSLWPSPRPTWDLSPRRALGLLGLVPAPCFPSLRLSMYLSPCFVYFRWQLPPSYFQQALSFFLTFSSVFSKRLISICSLALSPSTSIININNGACCYCCQPGAAAVLLPCWALFSLICCFLSHKSHQLLLKPSSRARPLLSVSTPNDTHYLLPCTSCSGPFSVASHWCSVHTVWACEI